MKIRKIELPFLACERSTLIECSGVDKNTAEGIAVALGYFIVQDLENDLEFIIDGETMGSWIEEGGLCLFIDEGSEAETKYLSLGGEKWVKKLLTNKN